MKKHILKLLALALCAVSLLSLTALAEEDEAAPKEEAPVQAEEEAPAAPAAVPLRGTVKKQENGSLLLTSSAAENEGEEIVVHVPEGTPYVDSVTGEPLNLEELKDGDFLYIWTSPAMTMSLPPQTSAFAIVGKIPADKAVPQYVEVNAPAVFPAPGGEGERRIPYAGGTLTVNDATEVKPHLTRNIVTLEDLIPGTRLLAWTGEDGKAERVLVFAYGYQGYLEAGEDGAVRLNGEDLAVKGRVVEDAFGSWQYVPLRAVAEAAGYEVKWVSGKGAVVSQGETELFTVSNGAEEAQTADDPYGLIGACVIDQGVTYLPAMDVALLLNLYLCA